MKFVEPIRDIKKISQIKNQLKWENKIRDLLLFELWINSALRISDLLEIKVKDLFDDNLNANSFFDIKEEKTSKYNRITITPKVKITLKSYKEKYDWILNDNQNYIFFNSKKSPIWKYSIWRKQTWVFMSNLCKWVWLKWNFWNHTLRKTWWYQARKQWIPLEIIQHKLNHSSLTVTQRYLWITADEIEEACNRLDL